MIDNYSCLTAFTGGILTDLFNYDIAMFFSFLIQQQFTMYVYEYTDG